MTLDELIRQRAIERVDPDHEAAAAALEEAARHLKSAKKIRESDSHGAFQLAYDGARKAIVGSMRAEGLRVRRGEGVHVITAQYAGSVIDDVLGKQFERMRRTRNVSEYGIGHLELAQVDAAIETLSRYWLRSRDCSASPA